MMKLIDKNIVDALLRYLNGRPYNEVYQVIPLLNTLQDAPPVKEEAPANG